MGYVCLEEGVVMRLKQDQVERIFNKGRDKSLKNFATRLLKIYFSKEELADRDVTLCGRGTKQKLDPVRIDYIKNHLVDFNGGPISEKQWNECKYYMSSQLKKV